MTGVDMTESLKRDAVAIRKLIRDAEALSDEVLVACSRLKQAMVVARQHPSVAKAAGQGALMRLGEAESQALALSGNLFRVHDELNRLSVEYAGGEDGAVTVLAGLTVADTRSAMEA